MARVDFRRDDLEQALLEGARGEAPMVLAGPPGAGKTTLLRRLQKTLQREGVTVVRLDLMGAASSPERFLRIALDVIPAAAAAPALPLATEIRRLAGSADRRQVAKAVGKLLELWSQLGASGKPPVALLFDEFTEIRSLDYFKDLRGVASPFVKAMRARNGGTVLATSYPTVARKVFGLEAMLARPLDAAETAQAVRASGARWDGAAVHAVSAGMPRYLDALLDAGAPELRAAWLEAMAGGGRIESLCRHTHEALLLRSRGYGICKAVLQAVAEEPGQNLTSLCKALGRTPGALREYLQWLVQVDALAMVRKRYVFVDPLIGHWVRLHARGVDATTQDLADAFAQLGGTAAAAIPIAPAPRTAPARSKPPRRPASDQLMEID